MVTRKRGISGSPGKGKRRNQLPLSVRQRNGADPTKESVRNMMRTILVQGLIYGILALPAMTYRI